MAVGGCTKNLVHRCLGSDLTCLEVTITDAALPPPAPPVHTIKLTEEREITPYLWVHPDEDR